MLFRSARGIPVRVFTNGTAKPPAAYAASLRRAGFDVADEEMMTPSSSAAAWFVRNKVARVRVLGVPGCAAPLADAGIEVVAPAASAGDAVRAAPRIKAIVDVAVRMGPLRFRGTPYRSTDHASHSHYHPPCGFAARPSATRMMAAARASPWARRASASTRRA